MIMIYQIKNKLVKKNKDLTKEQEEEYINDLWKKRKIN